MEKTKIWRQFLMGSIANLTSISLNIYSSWSSPVAPKLANVEESPLDYPVPETSVEAGWISSLISLGAVIGSFITWQLIDRIGRKWCLLISSILYLVSNAILLYTIDIWTIYVSRFLQGFGAAFGMIAVPIYQVEISSDEYRGAVGSLYNVFSLIGTSFILVIGPLLSYTSLQWACIPFPILSIITIWLIPETPTYHIMKGRVDDARKSLQILRGKSEKGILDEFQTIRSTVEKSMINKGRISDLIKNRTNLKALAISSILIFVQQCGGSNVVYVDTQSIFATSGAFDVTYGMIVLSVANLIAGIVTLLILDSIGRKIAMLISAVLMGVTMIGLGLFYYIQTTTGDITHIRWLPLTCLLGFVAAFTLGFGYVPWIYINEIFPSNVNSLVSALMVSFCWVLTFIITLWYPQLSALGVYYIFWGFAAVSLFGIFFVYFFVFETKGLSLKEIQIMMNS